MSMLNRSTCEFVLTIHYCGICVAPLQTAGMQGKNALLKRWIFEFPFLRGANCIATIWAACNFNSWAKNVYMTNSLGHHYLTNPCWNNQLHSMLTIPISCLNVGVEWGIVQTSSSNTWPKSHTECIPGMIRIVMFQSSLHDFSCTYSWFFFDSTWLSNLSLNLNLNLNVQGDFWA